MCVSEIIVSDPLFSQHLMMSRSSYGIELSLWTPVFSSRGPITSRSMSFFLSVWYTTSCLLFTSGLLLFLCLRRSFLPVCVAWYGVIQMRLWVENGLRINLATLSVCCLISGS